MPKSKVALQEIIETEEQWTNLLDKEVKKEKNRKKLCQTKNSSLSIVPISLRNNLYCQVTLTK